MRGAVSFIAPRLLKRSATGSSPTPDGARSADRQHQDCASEVDALREKGYLEAGAPIHEAIEAYSDLRHPKVKRIGAGHAYLPKPFSESDLNTAIERVLEPPRQQAMPYPFLPSQQSR